MVTTTDALLSLIAEAKSMLDGEKIETIVCTCRDTPGTWEIMCTTVPNDAGQRYAATKIRLTGADAD